MIQSLRPVKKEEEREERPISPGGLKLRLKLPQQPSGNGETHEYNNLIHCMSDESNIFVNNE